jgi:hypothetical protein
VKYLALILLLLLALATLPFVAADNTNLAYINDGEWNSDATWTTCPADNIYYDTTTMYDGHPSWRIEPGVSYGPGHDWGMLHVHPGDHIVMSVWVKTSGTPDSVAGRSGAMMGMDMYGYYNGVWARIGACNSPEFVPIKGAWGIYGWPSDGATWMVNWGSDWVFRTYDFIVPDLWWGDGGFGTLPNNQVPHDVYAAPVWICPWFMVSANYGSLSGTYTSWFSDFQLYINPTTPTPTPAPSPTPTPTPTPSPTPDPSATPTPTPTPTSTPTPTPVPSPLVPLSSPHPSDAPTPTPQLPQAQTATNQVFTNVYIALGIAVVSTLIAGCYIIIAAFNSGNGNARFGVGLVIVSIIEVVIGVVVVSAFQGSMGTVAINLLSFKGVNLIYGII